MPHGTPEKTTSGTEAGLVWPLSPLRVLRSTCSSPELRTLIHLTR
jgi:hypothetical protein